MLSLSHSFARSHSLAMQIVSHIMRQLAMKRNETRRQLDDYMTIVSHVCVCVCEQYLPPLPPTASATVFNKRVVEFVAVFCLFVIFFNATFSFSFFFTPCSVVCLPLSLCLLLSISLCLCEGYVVYKSAAAAAIH